MFQQFLYGISVLRKNSHADADSDRKDIPVHIKRGVESFHQFIDEVTDIRFPPKSVDQHDELVAPQSRNNRIFLYNGSDPFPHFHQEPIAKGVTEGIIDEFKIIDIDEKKNSEIPFDLSHSYGFTGFGI